jgi:hypothetical protein
VVSRVHALAAAFRAVNDLIEGRLRSRNVHSEVVFALSPNNNVSVLWLRLNSSGVFWPSRLSLLLSVLLSRSILVIPLCPLPCLA